jgi:hypothetical protein
MAAGNDWRSVIPDEDRPIVNEMKERLKRDGISIPNERLNNDVFLARFSRARDRKVDAAYEMLRNALKWRADNRVDSIKSDLFLSFFILSLSL